LAILPDASALNARRRRKFTISMLFTIEPHTSVLAPIGPIVSSKAIF